MPAYRVLVALVRSATFALGATLVAGVLVVAGARHLVTDHPDGAQPRGRAVATGAVGILSAPGAYILRTGGGCGAYTTIAGAVAAAMTGDTIHACAGIHELAAGIVVSVDDLTIEGDGTTATTLDGMGSWRILEASGLHLTVRAMTLTRGTAPSSEDGGAIRAERVDASEVVFRANAAPREGGAITAAWVAATDATFVDNTAGVGGGAMRVIRIGSSGGDVAISSGTFLGNQATAGPGGAIYAEGTVAVTDGTFLENFSGASGGGAIFAYTLVDLRSVECRANVSVGFGGGGAVITNAIALDDVGFFDNTASANGGAVWSRDRIAITDATFIGNSAGADGGAIFFKADGPEADGAFTIERGEFSGNTAAGAGGAIATASQYGSVDVIGSSFVGNSGGSGGAIHAAGSVSVSDASFAGNTAAYGNGGAISVENPIGALAWAIRDTEFSGNTASGVFGGGAVHASGPYATLEVTGSSFRGNSTDMMGGAILVYGATTSLSDATFIGNSADGGGALAYYPVLTNDPLVIRHSEFSGNTAVGGEGAGGAIYNDGAPTEIASSRFADNMAATFGGAIRSISTVSASDATFAGNAATTDLGGAIYAVSVSLTDATFAGNDAGGSGGAVSGTSSVFAVRSTFSGNHSSDEGGAILAGAWIELADTLLSDNSASINGGALRATGGGRLVGVRFLRNTAVNAGGGATLAPERQAFVIGAGTRFVDGSAATGGAIWVRGDPSQTTGEVVRLEGMVELSGNTAVDGGGGAILNLGRLEVSGATFVRNVSSGNGGAIQVGSGNTATILDAAFLEGSAVGYGGAIEIDDGAQVRIARAAFHRNTATRGGAISLLGRLVLEGSTLRSNVASEYGGGIYSAGQALRVANSTLVENTSGSGGGAIRIEAGSTDLTHGTFIDNAADSGIAQIDAPASYVSSRDSLYVGGDCAIGGPTAIGANLTTDPTCTGSVIAPEELLLGDLEGPEHGIQVVPLRIGSAAIDPTAGTEICSVATDQLGRPRPAVARCDAGAWEYQGEESLATATTATRFVDGVEPTSGTSLTSGDRIRVHAVVTGFVTEPTSGSVVFRSCRSATAIVECTAGTPWQAIGGGTISLTEGTTPGDDAWEATLHDFAPVGGGYYLIAATFRPGTGGGYAPSADRTSATFRVGASRKLEHAGPWDVDLTTATGSYRYRPSATIEGEGSGCGVAWDISTASGVAVGSLTATATAGDALTASGSRDLTAGIYVVTVRWSDCDGTADPSGFLAVLPPSVSSGAVASGRYDWSGGTDPSVRFGLVVSRSSIYNPRTKTTTWWTPTRLLWVQPEAWRLRVDRTDVSTSSAWKKVTCPLSVPLLTGTVCGELRALGILERWDDATKAWTSPAAVWLLAVIYDGGSTKTCAARRICTTTLANDWFGIAEVRAGTSAGALIPDLPVGAPVRISGAGSASPSPYGSGRIRAF